MPRAQRMICRLALWAGVIVLSLSLGATAESNVVVRRTSTGELQTLDPQTWTYGQDGNIAQDLFQGLTTLDPAANTIPGQARSWTVSADGKRYTFTLRDNLRWSDGRVLTSEDFLWSFRRLFDPKTAAPAVSLLYVIRNGRAVNSGKLPVTALGVSAPNPMTVIIDLEHPAPYLTDLLVHRAFPVPRHVIEKHGKQWTRPEHIVSNGAFVFREWRPGSHVRLDRNPRFHEAASVRLDSIYHVPIEDPKTALTRYRAGELDVLVTLPSEQLAELKASYGSQLRLVRQIGLEYLAFNTRRGATADVRVRRALSMAIDRDRLVQRVMRAGEPPAYCVVPEGVINYPRRGCADFATLSVSARVAEARRLLQEAGFGPKQPLRLRFRVNNSDTQRRLALAISAMWQPLGVRTELIGAELKAHQVAVAQGDFDVARGAWYGEDRDAISFLRLLDARSSSLNISGYASRQYQQWLDKADSTVDLLARAEFMREAESLAMREQPIAPVHVYVSRRLISPRVQGWVDNPRGLHLNRYLSVVSTSSIHSPAAPRTTPARRPE
ncbi:MAG: peptide ABC transporter substrate-binding protein [Sinobacteraceae bacterium]|nr:peptide ABC transporter substrate-binding protein [Nevskiaceae bacterium]